MASSIGCHKYHGGSGPHGSSQGDEKVNSVGPATVVYEECSSQCRSFVHVLFSHYLSMWQEEPSDYFVNVIIDDVSVLPK
jgi:hypothetical protein